jgi:hypothetical protein
MKTGAKTALPCITQEERWNLTGKEIRDVDSKSWQTVPTDPPQSKAPFPKR